VREVLGFPARLIPELPVGTALLCRRLDGQGPLGGAVLITTSKPAYVAARAMHVPVLAGGELLALTAGVEADRVTAPAAAQWWANKVEDGAWRLTLDAALSGVDPEPPMRGSSALELRTVLRFAGLRLCWVGTGDEVPAELVATREAARQATP
jgi:hypothetical protein